MIKATLHIENSYEQIDFDLADEVSIGRSDHSDLVLSDTGLSRKNTTIFRDGDAVLIVDENSLNGTFLNGIRLKGAAEELRNSDEIRIGSETRIRVSIGEGSEIAILRQNEVSASPAPLIQHVQSDISKPPAPTSQPGGTTIVL